MIRSTILEHSGGYYVYRLHDIKINKLCRAFPALCTYLNKVFLTCPNKFFNEGPRSSTLKIKLNADILEVKGHEASVLAKHGLEENKDRFRSAHAKVQLFMLENDSKTIAMEVPIWVMPNEIDNFKSILKSEKPLTGHIDVLRIDDNKIWIYDYKPDARKEKYATTQVFFYALMLSKRTGISLEHFRCGYFDDNVTYLFAPKVDCLRKNELLQNYIEA